MDRLVQFFRQKEIKKVLDIGTGTGDFVKTLDTVFGGSVHITGVDPGEEWLKQARKRFPQKNIEFLQMTGEKLEFEDNTFDVVTISNALHHLRDISASIAEMKRVLKLGGYIIINELHSDDLSESQENQKMLHHFKSFVDRLNGISHHETWTKKEILDIINSQGIDVKLSFSHERMPEPNFDPEVLDEKYKMMVGHLADLQGKPEYSLMQDKLPVFRKRLQKYGFQMAGQLMVVGQFR